MENQLLSDLANIFQLKYSGKYKEVYILGRNYMYVICASVYISVSFYSFILLPLEDHWLININKEIKSTVDKWTSHINIQGPFFFTWCEIMFMYTVSSQSIVLSSRAGSDLESLLYTSISGCKKKFQMLFLIYKSVL